MGRVAHPGRIVSLRFHHKHLHEATPYRVTHVNHPTSMADTSHAVRGHRSATSLRLCAAGHAFATRAWRTTRPRSPVYQPLVISGGEPFWVTPLLHLQNVSSNSLRHYVTLSFSATYSSSPS
ncbi:hypothetical protein Hanom_Chr17g01570761 [Helianthus anomalus]